MFTPAMGLHGVAHAGMWGNIARSAMMLRAHVCDASYPSVPRGIAEEL